MAWVYLIVAGVLESFWAVGLKQSEGFTKLWPSLISASLIVTSLFLLSLAMRVIPISTAYAIWTGIGVALLAIYGMLFMGEPLHILRLICLSMIILGVIGLKYLT